MTWIIIAIGLSVLLAAAIAALTFVILRQARPADFRARPSAAGLMAEQVAPQGFGVFIRPPGLEPDPAGNVWRARYAGPGGHVDLVVVQAESAREAVRVLARLRRGRSRRVTIAAKLAGDRSFLVMRRPPGRLVAWTNAGWAFAAESADITLLTEFVRMYPY